MGFFDTVLGMILLGLSAFWIYSLKKSRADLFERSVLVKASNTLVMIALGLIVLVAFLSFLIPSSGAKKATVAPELRTVETQRAQHSGPYDRSV